MIQGKKNVKLLTAIIVFCSSGVVVAQTEFDVYNIYDVQIFKKDSIAKENRIRSIIEYKQSLNGGKKLLSQKEFNAGYLTGYQRYFLDYPIIIKGKVFSEFADRKDVEYTFDKSKYKQDSAFFASLFNEFISMEAYNGIQRIFLKIRYTQKTDTLLSVMNYLNNNALGAEYFLTTLHNAPVKEKIAPKLFNKSLSKKDTIVSSDTNWVGNYRIISTYFNTIFNDPVVYERTSFLGDSIIGEERDVREYDDNSRIVFYAHYATLEDPRKLKLNTSEKTQYHKDGRYTFYEDTFLADGKPDVVSEYNKRRALVSYKKYFREGGFSEKKYTYDYRGLLLTSSSYLDGKYVEKNIYTYSFER